MLFEVGELVVSLYLLRDARQPFSPVFAATHLQDSQQG